MRSVSRWVGSVALVTLTAGVAGAQTWTMELSPLNEAPPVTVFTSSTGGARPASFGMATFVLSGAGPTLQLSMTATINNIDVNGLQTPNDLNDNLAAAHIHASNVSPPPATRPVVWGFFGAPDNDIAPDNLVVTPFTGGLVGGTFTSIWNALEGNAGTTLQLQLDNLLNGRAYLNFHTVQYGGGEIRGNFAAVVPEPSTYVLLASGLAGVGLIARRRRA